MDYGDDVEISQDGQINFTSKTCQRGVNHLICLGKGDLKDRIVVHLYAQPDGSISQSQYYTGIDEIAEIYDNNNAEADTLTESGTQKLQELMNYQTFTAAANDSDNINIDIGDTISGRDYITGTYIKKPIAQKILKIKNQRVSVEYKLEGEGV